VRARHC